MRVCVNVYETVYVFVYLCVNICGGGRLGFLVFVHCFGTL